MSSPEWLKPIESWIMNVGGVILTVIITIIFKILPREDFTEIEVEEVEGDE